MFKNDRMMLILTGLVLAIFAGSMVQYGDRIMSLMGGKNAASTQDDSYSVRAGSTQILDVLSNDKVKGPLVVLSRPSCGSVELTSNNRLSFTSLPACNGAVEFAYCVDSEGSCEPNAVKINVISVNYAQAGATEPTTTPATNTPVPSAPANTTTASNQAASTPSAQPPSPTPATEAPQIATFAVEMAPPALAAPSVSELVSPSVAVASIRQSAGGLNSVSSTDQNISTQNSASIGQTASAGPSAFAAPSIGESSNISLGGTNRVIAAVPPPPTPPGGLAIASNSGNSISQLERGPEALASLQSVQPLSATSESAPLAANPERAAFAPTIIASAQAPTPAPDSRFNAAPNAGGPIALIALNRAPTRGTGAGESLNVILTEPGLQSFAAPNAPAAVLTPTSSAPSSVSVMARGPNVSETLAPLGAPARAEALALSLARFNDRAIRRSPFQASTAPLTAGNGQTFSKPAISLAPAEQSPVLNASLTATDVPPIATAPAQNSACEIVLDAQPTRGANIQLEIAAACKPYQMVTISHAAIAFSMLTDAQGRISVQLPAMEENAEMSVKFVDDSQASTTVTVADIGDIVRAGVSWQANMNIDLSAIEFGAAIGSDGYISPATPRDYRTSRIKGGGYLVQLGDPSLAGGALAEVYTLPVARNQQRGTIALSIAITDAENACGQFVSAKTVRTRDGQSAGIRSVRFTVPACGTVSGLIPLPGAIDDIRLAGR